MAKSTSELSVWTIGHSTHPADKFITLLRTYDVVSVIDVRTVPGSRHNPQYGERELEKWLPESGISYCRMKALGGLRKTSSGSINGGWRNASFRGFADYMQSSEFSAAVNELIEFAKRRSVVIMCAEAVPWRCHRSLIGDALLARNVPTIDIMTEKSAIPHNLTSFAKVEGNKVWYPEYES